MRVALTGGAPEALVAGPPLYCLGVGGPPDAESIGLVERFVWRFAVLEAEGEALPLLIAFTGMPALMACTRTLNAESPFCLPTEALRLSGADLAGPMDLAILIDPRADDLRALLARGRVVERALPALAPAAGE